MTNDEIIEWVGQLADKASNYSEYAPQVNPKMSGLGAVQAASLGQGIVELRNELVDLLVALGGEKPWWAEVQP